MLIQEAQNIFSGFISSALLSSYWFIVEVIKEILKLFSYGKKDLKSIWK